MNEAAEELQFERAAVLRDRLRAIQKLGTRQHVVAGCVRRDGRYRLCEQTRACVCVLHYSAGTLQDKEYVLPTSPRATLPRCFPRSSSSIMRSAMRWQNRFALA